MRLVLDIQGAQGSNNKRGIGRYCLSLAQAIAKSRGDNELIIILNGSLPSEVETVRVALDGLLPVHNIRVWCSPYNIEQYDELHSSYLEAAHILREKFISQFDPDWVILASLFEGLNDNTVTSINLYGYQRTATIVYDLIPLIHENKYLQSDHYRNWYLKKLDNLRRSDLLLCISGSTANEVIKLLGYPSTDAINISSAADNHFRPYKLTAQEYKKLKFIYHINRPFVLYTGGGDERKNIDGLIFAWGKLSKSLRSSFHLVIVCQLASSDRERFSARIAALGLHPNEVIFPGYVSDTDLLLFYNACELFVFPSWHEGFGLPILEAMQCGKPVLAANRTSLPEVVGRNDALFDPFDCQDMATHIERALIDAEWRKSLTEHAVRQAHKFTWSLTAKRVWNSLEKRMDSKMSAQLDRTKRLKLALFSPLPPEQSGIADYSVELIKDLTRWYQIDVIVREPSIINSDSIISIFNICSIGDFLKSANDYDRILYHFGNSEYHEYMFEILHSHPGIVVLHDFFLSGIQAWSEFHSKREHAWTSALYSSHGYKAIVARYQTGDTSEVIKHYPANLPVLQQALGVIVHSESSVQMAKEWYGEKSVEKWSIIPLLRALPSTHDRTAARIRLGLSEEAFVVCSFGILTESKLIHQLIEAWRGSVLGKDNNARLVFVGEPADKIYFDSLQAAIGSCLQPDNISITGWVEPSAYRDWLMAADIGVQLRTNGRGESSAAVLDCLSYGLATIVNAHGSFDEIDSNAVWKLPDAVSNESIVNALESLAKQSSLRKKTGRNGQQLIERKHNPRVSAELYFNAIEDAYRNAERSSYGAVRLCSNFPAKMFSEIAICLSRNHPPSPRISQVLVDVSELVRADVKSGVQRVVRAVLTHWLQEEPPGYRIEPVYANNVQAGYRYARRWTCQFLGIPCDWAIDEPVEAWPTDIFVGLDLQPIVVPAQQAVWKHWKTRGVKIVFVLYDLLPMSLSKAFFAGAAEQHSNWLQSISNGALVIAISRSVAVEYRDWLNTQKLGQQLLPEIAWFHLGADIENSQPTQGVPDSAAKILSECNARITILMVGTLEPRKGYAQTLSACERIWQKGIDFNLVIVGKQGWMADDIVKRMNNHAYADHRLFWLEGISDEYLDKLYGATTGCLISSEGEGFGLPIIEAAKHELPILVRDLPVFREVGGGHVTYFPNDSRPEILATSIELWINALKNNAHISSTGLSWHTWRQSAENLFAVIVGSKRDTVKNEKNLKTMPALR